MTMTLDKKTSTRTGQATLACLSRNWLPPEKTKPSAVLASAPTKILTGLILWPSSLNWRKLRDPMKQEVHLGFLYLKRM